MKNKIKKSFALVERAWLNLSLYVFALLASSSAFADASDPSIGTEDLGQVAQKLTGQADSFKNLLWSVSQVAGIVMAITGLMMWVRASKGESRHPASKCLVVALVGCVMFFLPTFMGVGASTFF